MTHKIFGTKENANYIDREGVYLVPIRDGKVGVIKTSKGYFLLGGGIESDESHEECIKRECLEEIGYTVSVGNKICSAEMYCEHPTIGYFHPMQTYYVGELLEQVSESIEDDHAFEWMDYSELVDNMYLEMQSWALEQCCKIRLEPMTEEMYHLFFSQYENDIELYLNKDDYHPYTYDKENVDRYIEKQKRLNRLPFAIMRGNEIVGELKLYDIEEHNRATLGITMKNGTFRDKGFGTEAERLVIDYVFTKLDIPVLYADSILSNTRSQHVLEKVGFQLIGQDDERKHYKITRK